MTEPLRLEGAGQKLEVGQEIKVRWGGELAKRGVCRTGLRVVGSYRNMAGKVSRGAGRTGLKQGLASVCGAQFDSVWRVSARK
jgi:hypothetical protein